jgi:hypothetical protein
MPSEDIMVGLVSFGACSRLSFMNSHGDLFSSSGEKRYSEECPVCASEELPFIGDFVVDWDGSPRPGTFSAVPGPGTWQPPLLRAFIDFLPVGWGIRTSVFDETGAAISHRGQGFALEPSFGKSVPFTPPGLGTLFVYLSISDPSSGVGAAYLDAIPVVDCTPRAQPTRSSRGQQTRYWIAPDPSRPSGFRTLFPHESGWAWNRPPAIELWEDEDGYYFLEKGEKHRLGKELP